VFLAVTVTTHLAAGLVVPVSSTAAVVLVLATLSLAWRRRAPFAVLAVNSAVLVVSEVVGYTLVRPLPFAVLVALYTVTARVSVATSVGTGAALGLVAVVAAIVRSGSLDDDIVDQLVALAAGWMLGVGVRLGRIRTALLESGAAHLVREQAVQTRLAVELERARIARELHDVVAHHVSIIVAQAGASGRVFDTRPEYARSALHSIETVGREALTEMRRLLSVLGPDEPEAVFAPQPGLGEVSALVAQMAQADVPVDLAVRGSPRRLPPGVELSAYRIVQESLTNTLKHAGPTRASVVLDYGTDVLELQITDDGRGRSAAEATSGHGLAGMRQRAVLLGGRLTTGPGPRGGFRVTAVLPVGRDACATSGGPVP
jgi:signal transduction histidine kinase